MQGEGDRPGWLGRAGELRFYLNVVGADRDDDGRYRIRGHVSSFLGLGDDADVVVGGDAEYFVGGHPKNLAAGLAATSAGLPAKVYV